MISAGHLQTLSDAKNGANFVKLFQLRKLELSLTFFPAVLVSVHLLLHEVVLSVSIFGDSSAHWAGNLRFRLSAKCA